ncbi:MAG: hypothetical protein ACO1SV_07320 [Fimbriimonas sp.]
MSNSRTHKISRLGLLAIVACALAAPSALAQSTGQRPTKEPPQAQAFTCVHCGLKIKVRSQADLKKTCAVCMCGTTNAACKPAKKPVKA